MARQPCKKDEDDNDHQAKRLKEGQQYLADAGRNCLRCVERHAVRDAWRKCRRELLHALVHGLAVSTALEPGS